MSIWWASITGRERHSKADVSTCFLAHARDLDYVAVLFVDPPRTCLLILLQNVSFVVENNQIRLSATSECQQCYCWRDCRHSTCHFRSSITTSIATSSIAKLFVSWYLEICWVPSLELTHSQGQQYQAEPSWTNHFNKDETRFMLHFASRRLL